MLTLAEEICLLSLLEKKETLRFPSSLILPFSFAGAVLMDLVLSNYIKIEGERPVPCVDSEQIQDEQMKRLIKKMQQVDKPQKLNHWVYLLGGKGKRIVKEIAGSLVENGILVEHGTNYQWAAQEQEDGTMVPTYAKYLLKREIRDTFFCNSVPTERSLAVISLMDASGMLDHLFTTDEMIFARKIIRSLKREAHGSAKFPSLLEQVDDAIDYATASATMK
jgi:hypothetical protein